MSPFLQLAFVLTVIIFSAKFAGYISTRIGQPSVFGELVIGLLLGPSLLNLTHLSFITDGHLEEIVHELGEIGVLLLMFLAGMELHIADLARNTRVSAFAGTLGVVVPVLLGYGAGILFGLAPDHAIFLGLTLGATSVSISAQTLMELDVLRSRVGLGLLGSAVFDDILVILLLSTFTALMVGGGGGAWDILLVFVRMVVFLGLSVGFGVYLLPRIVRIVGRLQISQGLTAIALVIMFIYAVSAELVGGMAAITGTFIAGLMFGRTPEKSRIEQSFHAIAYGLFVPIFFVDIGLRVNVQSLQLNTLWFMLAVTFVAVIGKVVGSGLGAKAGGFTGLQSLQLGIGMISRGEVGLIAASLGLSMGMITNQIFSSLVGMVLLSTLITPPLLRFSIMKTRKNEELDQGTNPVNEKETA